MPDERPRRGPRRGRGAGPDRDARRGPAQGDRAATGAGAGSGSGAGSGPGAGSDRALDPERCVYGRHPVREAARGRRRIRALHASPAALSDLGDVVAQLEAAGCSVTRVDDARRLDELARTSEHQGVVAEVDAYPYVSVDELLAAARRSGTPPLILCLDQVTDPHNLGAVARVADAAGATGVVVTEHRAARVTGAAVKASAGALEHVLVARCTNLANELLRVKGDTLWAYAATERGTIDWTDVDMRDGALLVLGAEGPGIRPRVLSACDAQVRIPMAGQVASLNVATVAAVLAFEVVRQRRGEREPA